MTADATSRNRLEEIEKTSDDDLRRTDSGLRRLIELDKRWLEEKHWEKMYNGNEQTGKKEIGGRTM